MTVAQSGVVLSIHLQPVAGGPSRSTDEARAIVGHGLDGDYHGKRRPHTDRQVLLVDRLVLESLGFAHGALREQLTVDFDGLDALAGGARLRAGEVELEVTGSCDPCEGIGRINRVADPEALRRTLEGRRGILAKVVEISGAGRIRLGDVIEVVAPAGAVTPSPGPATP